jgi:hypothetical protein
MAISGNNVMVGHLYSGVRLQDSRAYATAKEVVALCSEALKTLSGADYDFVKALSEYLDKRKDQIFSFSCDLDQIQSRAEYIRELLGTITPQKKSTQQFNLLKEDRIGEFEGCFSKRLYNLLVARREVVRNELPSIQLPSRLLTGADVKRAISVCKP